MNVHRFERISFVGVKEKPKAFVAKDNRHITHTIYVAWIALATKSIDVILADYAMGQTASQSEHVFRAHMAWLQDLSHKYAIGVFFIIRKRRAIIKPEFGIEPASRVKERHRTRFQT